MQRDTRPELKCIPEQPTNKTVHDYNGAAKQNNAASTKDLLTLFLRVIEHNCDGDNGKGRIQRQQSVAKSRAISKPVARCDPNVQQQTQQQVSEAEVDQWRRLTQYERASRDDCDRKRQPDTNEQVEHRPREATSERHSREAVTRDRHVRHKVSNGVAPS